MNRFAGTCWRESAMRKYEIGRSRYIWISWVEKIAEFIKISIHVLSININHNQLCSRGEKLEGGTERERENKNAINKYILCNQKFKSNSIHMLCECLHSNCAPVYYCYLLCYSVIFHLEQKITATNINCNVSYSTAT